MKEVFPIIPAGKGPVIAVWIIALILGGIIEAVSKAPPLVFWIVAPTLGVVIFLLCSFVYASRYVRFEVSPEGLAIRGDIYGRRLPAAVLKTSEARTLDLTATPNFRLVWRTNGAGLPGYGSGWFRLANGDKALVFVTDKQRVVYLPTRKGYVLLVSVEEPEKFLEALRQLMP